MAANKSLRKTNRSTTKKKTTPSTKVTKTTKTNKSHGTKKKSTATKKASAKPTPPSISVSDASVAGKHDNELLIVQYRSSI